MRMRLAKEIPAPTPRVTLRTALDLKAVEVIAWPEIPIFTTYISNAARVLSVLAGNVPPPHVLLRRTM